MSQVHKVDKELKELEKIRNFFNLIKGIPKTLNNT